MDLTPHLATGAALGARVNRPALALGLAFASHFVLDAIPHYHLAWIASNLRGQLLDAAIGFLAVGLIVLRTGHLWPVVCAIVAVLPDLPGLFRVEHALPFPHPMWLPPGGVLTQIAVTGLACWWGITAGAGWPAVAPPDRGLPR